ncbi:MAG: SGNH/GDSL hydrolase family protein [Phycisphaeraceae bacterium]
MDLKWYDAREFTVEGAAWPAEGHDFDRLPPRAEGLLNDDAWRQARHAVGIRVGFEAATSALHARATLREPPPPQHAYSKWLDLYARDGDRWRWAASATHGYEPSGETPLFTGWPEVRRTYRLMLPVTFAVDRLELGFPEGVEPKPAPAETRRPIALYGTSVVKGGEASRPGLTWPACLERDLDWPVLNLGFSGAARSEPTLAPLLAEIDAEVFVVDPVPNMDPQLIEQNLEPFLRGLMTARPNTPILMIGPRRHADHWIRGEDYTTGRGKQVAAFEAVYHKCREDHPGGLHYLPGSVLEDLPDDYTVDASHPNDWGNALIAQRVAAAIEPLLPR